MRKWFPVMAAAAGCAALLAGASPAAAGPHPAGAGGSASHQSANRQAAAPLSDGAAETGAAAQGGAPPGSAGSPAKCLPFPRHLELNPLLPLPKPPPGSTAFHDPLPGCAYVAGSVHLAKLDKVVPVGPGLTDLRIGIVTYADFTKGFTYLQLRWAGRLEYHGRPELPPVRATFRAFGAVPVSATLEISEIGSLNVALIACVPGKSRCPSSPPTVALVYARVSLRLYDVSVGGVPLEVGPHCQTATPFTLALTGRPPGYNVAAAHGVLTGTVTIPQFSGCASEADNLLFDATVSGPGNSVRVNQGVVCTPAVTGHPGCPPARPEPVR